MTLIGDRLDLAAEKQLITMTLFIPARLCEREKIDGNRVVRSFDNTGSGLTTCDQEPPAEFAVGGDKIFYWATAHPGREGIT